jgi:hypothetical protein
MIQTRELRPGDVVATFDQYGGRIDRAVDLTLPLHPVVWRTVAAVDGDNMRRVVFTDDTRLSTWGDMVWHRLDDDQPDREPTPADEEGWTAREEYARGNVLD